MNETGKVFMGTHQRPKGRRWIYGQFSDVVLPAIQLLMEMSGLNATERGNPVQVVRAISSVINSTESDEGLLEGKWEGAFEDGTSPWAWTGSSKIFEQFLRNGCKAVKYGQCWVFSAIATTSKTLLIKNLKNYCKYSANYLLLSLSCAGNPFTTGDQLRVSAGYKPYHVCRQVL